MLRITKNKIMIIISLIIIIGLSIGLPVYFLLIKNKTKSSQNNNQQNINPMLGYMMNYNTLPEGTYIYQLFYEDYRTYSSFYDASQKESTLDSKTCWSAAVSDMNQWLNIDLNIYNRNKTNPILGIVIRGRGDRTDQYVTSFKVNYIDSAGKTIPADNGKIYDTNLNGDISQSSFIYFTTPLVNPLNIIILPQTWVNWIALRADLFYKI
jgi:hypothetical protein